MTMKRRVFDPTSEQTQLQSVEGIPWLFKTAEKFKANPRAVFMSSHSALMDIAYAYISGCDLSLVDALRDEIASWARLSLERGEWQAVNWWAREGAPDGEVWDRAEAWVAPHLVLIVDEWLRTGDFDRGLVDSIFTKQLFGEDVLTGVWEADTLMPLSAWPQIFALNITVDPHYNKRRTNATSRIATDLATDPGQVHDPKSPLRARSRAYMRSNMSPNWLATGLSKTAMNWLWTFEWREGQSGLSPREVLLRAYA